MLVKRIIMCVLLQEQEAGTNRPFAYLSRTVTEKEQKLATTRTVPLPVVWVATLLHPYLKGNYFTVRTDYDALRWIFVLAKATGELV